MPGPGGNQGKKKKPAVSKSYGRYRERYGKLVRAKGTNPGAEVYEREFRSSDAIRGYGSDNPKTPYGS